MGCRGICRYHSLTFNYTTHLKVALIIEVAHRVLLLQVKNNEIVGVSHASQTLVTDCLDSVCHSLDVFRKLYFQSTSGKASTNLSDVWAASVRPIRSYRSRYGLPFRKAASNAWGSDFILLLRWFIGCARVLLCFLHLVDDLRWDVKVDNLDVEVDYAHEMVERTGM